MTPFQTPFGCEIVCGTQATHAAPLIQAAMHATSTLRAILRHALTDTQDSHACTLRQLLSLLALLLPAAAMACGPHASAKEQAAANAAVDAASEACHCVSLLMTSAVFPVAVLRDALSDAAAYGRCDVAVALTLVLRAESLAPFSVRSAACHALAALLSTAPVATSLLTDSSRNAEKQAPAGSATPSTGVHVGKAIAVGLLNTLASNDQHQAAQAESWDTRPVLTPMSPQQATNGHVIARGRPEGPRYRLRRTDTCEPARAALQLLLAFSVTAKEHVLQEGVYKSWVDAAVRSCTSLVSRAEADTSNV
jgi:hypothetical protein